jgi:predicted nucleotidyltransferase
VGRALQYEVDRESPVARELERLVHATVGIEAALRAALEGVRGVEEAFIFGSYASGELRGHSDIDLLVVGKPDQDDLTRRLASVEQLTGRDVNIVTYGRAELERKRAAGEVFVQDVLGGPRVALLPRGGGDAVPQSRRTRARRTPRVKAPQ